MFKMNRPILDGGHFGRGKKPFDTWFVCIFAGPFILSLIMECYSIFEHLVESIWRLIRQSQVNVRIWNCKISFPKCRRNNQKLRFNQNYLNWIIKSHCSTFCTQIYWSSVSNVKFNSVYKICKFSQCNCFDLRKRMRKFVNDFW